MLAATSAVLGMIVTFAFVLFVLGFVRVRTCATVYTPASRAPLGALGAPAVKHS